MIKVTIILAILFVVFLFVTKILIAGMTFNEKLFYTAREEYPKRVYISTAITFLCLVAAIVCLIISVIQW